MKEYMKPLATIVLVAEDIVTASPVSTDNGDNLYDYDTMWGGIEDA